MVQIHRKINTTFPKIDTAFESGNFIVHTINERKIIGTIRKDSNNKDFQWFYFSVESENPNPLDICIKDIQKSSYPTAWEGYQICIKHEGYPEWHRANTTVIDGNLFFNLSIKKKIFVAYFQPYTLEQHKALSSRFKVLRVLISKFSEKTINNHEVELFHLAGTDSHPSQKNIWIIARQHPGESIVGWFMEGIATVFESENSLSDSLLKQYQFFIVHNANPDGVVYGSHRTNATGSDINRDWLNPKPGICPEVIAIRQWMEKYPPALFLDVHGDERTQHPYILVNPDTVSEEGMQLLKRLCKWNPGLEIRTQSVSEIDLSIGRHYVNHQFGCLALTLEMACQYHVSLRSDLIASVKKLSQRCLRAFLP